MGDCELKRSVKEFVAWVLRRRQVYRIRGRSMHPGIRDHSLVIVDPRAYQHGPPSRGDIVLVRHPYDRSIQLIKRVSEITADGLCYLLGDNLQESTDSRSFGPVPCDLVLGKVTGRLSS